MDTETSATATAAAAAGENLVTECGVPIVMLE